MPPSKKNSSLKTSTKKKKTPVTKSAPEPVPEVVQEPNPPSTPTANDSTCFDYSQKFSELNARLKEAQNIIKDTLSEMSKFEKQIAKDRKQVEKELKKENIKKTDRVLNGFSKPGVVSDELKKFFNLGDDEMIARTEVTKKITSYCQQHKLQNEKDKRIIKPNKDLKKLLRLGDKDELTYFNLQKYMKIHFPNKDGVFVNL